MLHTFGFPARLLRALALATLAGLTVSACGLFSGPPATAPTAASLTTRILIDSLSSGQAVGSPLVLSGRMAPRPPDNTVTYRVFGPNEALLASGKLSLQGPIEQPGAFAQTIPYQLGQPGPGRVEVLAIDPRSGTTLGISSVAVSLAASDPLAPTAPLPTAIAPTAIAPTAIAPTALPPPAAAQQIFIDTPAPFTEVGSPVVITGRTSLVPAAGLLSYIVRDANGATLGAGQIGVSPSGGGAFYNASISFTLPPNGGPIGVVIAEPSPTGGAPITSSAITLQVAVPQQIVLETPPPGTAVGSPLVITGRTARYPFQGNLAYRISDFTGRQLGGGIFEVVGGPGGPTSFAPSLSFNAPPQGGRIRVDVTDEDAADGRVVASAAIELNASPPAQQIFIDTPPAFTQIGSPVTLTGRTVRFPSGGRLSYRVLDGAGAQIAQGQFPASGTNIGAGLFNASIGFPLPAQGGQLSFEIFEVDAFNGAITTSANIPLIVNAAPPPPTATLPPIVGNQQILIETPPVDTAVGSPLTLTGRVARVPTDGNLNYRITDLSGRELASGFFPVSAYPGPGFAPWVGVISFVPPPGGGAIIVEVFDRNDPTNTVLASASIRLQVVVPQPRG